MLPDTTTIALVLFAALLHAVWNALVKTGSDRLLTLGAVIAAGALIIVPFVPFAGVPDRASWIYIALSVVLHLGYFTFLLKAYEVGDLSHVYPLARGAAPLMILGASALLADEHLPLAANLGAVLACAGIMSFAFEKGLPWKHDHRPLTFALTTSAFIAAYTLAGGLGVRLSGNTFGFICWLFLLNGASFSVYVWFRRRGHIANFARTHWRSAVLGGAASSCAYGLVIYAMNTAAMGAISALRETSVIMAVVIGSRLLGEPFGRRRLAAATVVLAGVAMMHWS